MKLPNMLLVLLLAILAVVPSAPALRAQFAGPEPAGRLTGVVEDRVFNAATGNALANARITLEGSGREVVTYSLTRRYSLYASLVDLGGFVQNNQRYAPTTPDYAKGTRWQELGFYTNVGVRGTF